ncbi:MAG: hypothetical protein GC131_02935 [Alphaproteobacteria bacterium]|nr:hypothetical protein [Alphaproteobacteria bacterium]
MTGNTPRSHAGLEHEAKFMIRGDVPLYRLFRNCGWEYTAHRNISVYFDTEDHRLDESRIKLRYAYRSVAGLFVPWLGGLMTWLKPNPDRIALKGPDEADDNVAHATIRPEVEQDMTGSRKDITPAALLGALPAEDGLVREAKAIAGDRALEAQFTVDNKRLKAVRFITLENGVIARFEVCLDETRYHRPGDAVRKAGAIGFRDLVGWPMRPRGQTFLRDRELEIDFKGVERDGVPVANLSAEQAHAFAMEGREKIMAALGLANNGVWFEAHARSKARRGFDALRTLTP